MALLELANRGMIVPMRNRGFKVQTSSLEDLEGLFELRFSLGRNAQRITFFFPGEERIVLLTTFHKQRSNERLEVERARQAMRLCIQEGHTAEGEDA